MQFSGILLFGQMMKLSHWGFLSSSFAFDFFLWHKKAGRKVCFLSLHAKQNLDDSKVCNDSKESDDQNRFVFSSDHRYTNLYKGGNKTTGVHCFSFSQTDTRPSSKKQKMKVPHPSGLSVHADRNYSDKLLRHFVVACPLLRSVTAGCPMELRHGIELLCCCP